MSETAERLSLRKTAEALGISHVALIKAVRDGRVTKGADGKFDVEQARREMAGNSHPKKKRQSTQRGDRSQETGDSPVRSGRLRLRGSRSPSAPRIEIAFGSADLRETVRPAASADTQVANGDSAPGGDLTIAEAARQLEWEKVRKARIANEEKLQTLVPLVQVNAWAAGMILKAREVLVRIPGKLRDRIAQTSDPVDCEKLLRDEVHQALNELAAYRP